MPPSKIISALTAAAIAAELSHAPQTVVGPGREHIEPGHPHDPLQQPPISSQLPVAVPVGQDEWPTTLQRPPRIGVASQLMGSPPCLLASD
jgi:hypothetical protein